MPTIFAIVTTFLSLCLFLPTPTFGQKYDTVVNADVALVFELWGGAFAGLKQYDDGLWQILRDYFDSAYFEKTTVRFGVFEWGLRGLTQDYISGGGIKWPAFNGTPAATSTWGQKGADYQSLKLNLVDKATKVITYGEKDDRNFEIFPELDSLGGKIFFLTFNATNPNTILKMQKATGSKIYGKFSVLLIAVKFAIDKTAKIFHKSLGTRILNVLCQSHVTYTCTPYDQDFEKAKNVTWAVNPTVKNPYDCHDDTETIEDDDHDPCTTTTVFLVTTTTTANVATKDVERMNLVYIIVGSVTAVVILFFLILIPVICVLKKRRRRMRILNGKTVAGGIFDLSFGFGGKNTYTVGTQSTTVAGDEEDYTGPMPQRKVQGVALFGLESMAKKGAKSQGGQKGDASSMAQNEATGSMVQKDATGSMVQKGATGSMVQKGATGSMVRKGATSSMVQKVETGSVVRKGAASSAAKKGAERKGSMSPGTKTSSTFGPKTKSVQASKSQIKRNRT